MQPYFSIIIPVYNTKEYLVQCIESVLAQVEKNDEVILIDDGSTDGSEVICETYAKVNKNVIYVKQHNMGQGGARNKGIKASSKEYIIFLDSDDYWEVNTLDVIKEVFANQDLDIIYFDAKCICDDDAFLKQVIFGNSRYNRQGHIFEEITSGEKYFKEAFPFNFTVQPCMSAYRRNFLIENGIYFQEGVYFEDNIFSFMAVLEADKVKYVSEKLYVRRYRHNSTMTSAMALKKLKDYVYVSVEVCNYILKIKHKYSGCMLWKIYYFAYKILDDFVSASSEYIGSRQDYADIERMIYKNIFMLTRYDDSNDGIALGKFLKSLEYVKTQTYGEELVNEVYANGKEKQVSIEKVYDFTRRKYKDSIDNKLKKLPIFKKDVRIGIYGTGEYTKCLLEESKTLGKITDNILFIDSYLEDEQKYMEHYPIINVRDVGCKVDKIIISSFKNETDMLKMANKYIHEKIEVVLLHDDEIGPIFWEYVC